MERTGIVREVKFSSGILDVIFMDIHVFQALPGEDYPPMSQPVRSSAPNIIARRVRERGGVNFESPRGSSYIEVKGANVSHFKVIQSPISPI
jgi:hypothetical protein